MDIYHTHFGRENSAQVGYFYKDGQEQAAFRLPSSLKRSVLGFLACLKTSGRIGEPPDHDLNHGD